MMPCRAAMAGFMTAPPRAVDGAGPMRRIVRARPAGVKPQTPGLRAAARSLQLAPAPAIEDPWRRHVHVQLGEARAGRRLQCQPPATRAIALERCLRPWPG